jgi:pyruvate dehydrogenase E1 component beta subunit
MVFEHKLLYWGKAGDIDFDGDLDRVCRPRKYTDGDDITIIATGAMVEQVVGVIGNNDKKYSAEVWNPFILTPLAFEPILDSIRRTGRLLVVQESGGIAGMGDHFISLAVRECFSELKRAPVLIAAPDTPVPFAKELETAFLPDSAAILRAMEKMIGDRP